MLWLPGSRTLTGRGELLHHSCCDALPCMGSTTINPLCCVESLHCIGGVYALCRIQ